MTEHFFASSSVKTFMFTGTLFAFLPANVFFLYWTEILFSARFPFRRGRAGVFQPFWDFIKLFAKKPPLPRTKWLLFAAAPVLAFIPLLACLAILLFYPEPTTRDSGMGLLLIFAMLSVSSLGVLTVGQATNNPHIMRSVIRAAVQNTACLAPLLLSVLSIVLLAGSLQPGVIVEAQEKFWFICTQPLAFTVFFCSELMRPGRSSAATGQMPQTCFYAEYTGPRLALFLTAEYTHLFLIAAIAASLFLGGWHGPYLPAPVWFLIKTYGFIFLLTGCRRILPGLRNDQRLRFAMKILIPLAMLNLLLTALAVTL